MTIAAKGVALLLTATVTGGTLLYVARDTTVTVTCGGPEVDLPAVSTAFAISDKITGSFNAVASGQVGVTDVAAAWFDTRAMGQLLAEYTAAGGREESYAPGEKIKADIDEAVADGVGVCCPTAPSPPGQVSAAVPARPERLTGPALAADALYRAAPRDRKWLDQIPLGVAVAKYESSFRATASNNVYSGHVGLWQISGDNAANLKLGDRTDPYVNARYAYALWKGRGGTWAKDWTTYPTAAANQDKYRQYTGTVQAAPAPTPEVPAPAGCGVEESTPQGGGEAAIPGVPAVPSQKVTLPNGKQVSAVTAAQLRFVEAKTGMSLVVMQGGYGGGRVAASGTSHNYPGSVDVACVGAAGCISLETAMRQGGFAAWARNVPGRSTAGSGSHVHGISLLDEGSRSAPQVRWSWPNRGNGLTGSQNDPASHPEWYPNLTRQLTQAKV